MKLKRTIIMFCATAVILSLTACGSKKGEEDKFLSEALNSSVEITEREAVESKSDVLSEEETKASSTGSNDDFNDIVVRDVEDSVAVLNAEYEELKAEIDTYTKYLSGTDKMEAFYARVYDTNLNLCVKMYEYSLAYAEDIVGSDMSNDDKYDELEELYDSIYEDAGDEIYDGIYDGILADMYDDFYDGLLDDAYDNKEYSEYSEWSELRSEEYEWWSGTRSDVYEDWADMRSDVYEFWSDLRGEIWDDDIDKAEKKIEDFREDIEKIKKDIEGAEDSDTSGAETAMSDIETEVPETGATETEVPKKEVPKPETPAENLVAGMRPEFKEALDSYEAFFDEYCDFVKKYSESPNDLNLLGQYAEYLTQYSETMEKLSALDDGEMNDAELKYYLEVVNRINEKLLDAAL